MDDTVARHDIGLDDARVIHHRLTTLQRDRYLLALRRLRRPQAHHVLGQQTARHHVVREDGLQLGAVLRLKQFLDRAGRQLGKRLIRRSEYGERTLSLQGLDQPRRLNRCHQRLERAGGDRCLDDVLTLLLRRHVAVLGRCRNADHEQPEDGHEH